MTIVVPHGNSIEKTAAMRAFGAELIEHGRDFDEAREAAIQIASERGQTRDFLTSAKLRRSLAHQINCCFGVNGASFGLRDAVLPKFTNGPTVPRMLSSVLRAIGPSF